MKQDKFTEQAQEALALSQEIVRQYRHSQWDVEHILLALLRQERGLVGEILRELGVDTEAIRQQVEKALDKSPKVAYETEQMYATPRVAQLITKAGEEAKRLKDEFIGTEHLLVAMASDPVLQNGTKGEIRSSFNKRAQIDDISAVNGSDLEIDKEGGQMVVGIAYSVKTPLFANISLFIDFNESSGK